jgi:hypothetical protein
MSMSLSTTQAKPLNPIASPKDPIVVSGLKSERGFKTHLRSKKPLTEKFQGLRVSDVVHYLDEWGCELPASLQNKAIHQTTLLPQSGRLAKDCKSTILDTVLSSLISLKQQKKALGSLLVGTSDRCTWDLTALPRDTTKLLLDGSFPSSATFLHIKNLDFREKTLANIAKLFSKIQVLILEECCLIKEFYFKELSQFQELRSLTILLSRTNQYANDPMTIDNGFLHLSKLPIQELKLCGLRLSAFGIQNLSIAKLPIQNLEIRDCVIVCEKHLNIQVKLPLKRLDLSNSIGFFDSPFIPDFVQQNPHLQELVLYNCLFKESCFEYFQNLSQLRSLDISHHPLRDSDLVHLAKLPLTDLNIKSCFVLTNQAFQTIGNLQLKSLDATSTSISKVGLEYLSKGNPRLQSLQLYCCYQFDLEAIKLLGNFKYLTQLDLSYNQSVTAKEIDEFAKAKLPLQNLNLSGCRSLNKDVFEPLKKLPLVKLNIKHTLLLLDDIQEFQRAMPLTSVLV